MEVQIDGAAVLDVLDVHRQLAAHLDFGPYYGWNTAALWDRLSTDVPRPVHVVWKSSAVSRERLGAEAFDALVDVMQRAQDQDADWGLMERFTYSLR